MELDDLNLWRSVVTVASLVLFLGLVFWTWSRHRAAVFDEAAQLPFAADDVPAPATTPSERK
jgi:cytochrome c oxidase cbb3-type subunit 4